MIKYLSKVQYYKMNFVRRRIDPKKLVMISMKSIVSNSFSLVGFLIPVSFNFGLKNQFDGFVEVSSN